MDCCRWFCQENIPEKPSSYSCILAQDVAVFRLLHPLVRSIRRLLEGNLNDFARLKHAFWRIVFMLFCAKSNALVC